MNKNLTKIAALSVSLAMAIGVGVALGSKAVRSVRADEELAYTVTLTGSTGESTGLTTSDINKFTGSGASTYLNAITAVTKSYGPTATGMKLGSSSDAGTITFSLKSAGQVTATKIVVSAKLYNSGKAATLNVNSIGAQSLSGDFNDYTFTFTNPTDITTLTFASSKYIWVQSVSVYKNSGAVTPAINSVTVNPTTLTLNLQGTTSKDVAATVNAVGGAPTDITWSVEDANPTGCVTVTEGTVTAVAVGTAKVRATSDYDNSKYADCTVTVINEAIPTFELINSLDELEAGAKYIITGENSGSVYTMATTDNTNNRRGTAVTVENGIITATESTLILELSGSTGAWKFQTTNYAGTDGYFTQGNQTSNNYLKIESTGDDFTIAFDGNAATITSLLKTTRNVLRFNYNGGSTIFACYTAGGNQTDVYLWKEVGEAQPEMEIWDTSSVVGSNTGYYFSNTSELYSFYTRESGATSSDPAIATTTWTSSNTSVATIRSDNGVGRLTTVSLGETTLTATAEGYETASVKISIVGGPLDSITVSGSMTKTAYTTNDTAWDPTGLTVTADYWYYEGADVTDEVEWTFDPAVPAEGVTSVVATASFEGETADSDAQSVTVTVAHAGTADDPFTVAEGIAKAKEIGTTAAGPWVTQGIICKVDEWNSEYPNITYWISDTGFGGNDPTTTIQCHRGKYLEGAAITADNYTEFVVGATVVVTGNLVNYNSNTPEYAANNYPLSLVQPSSGDFDVTFVPQENIEVGETGLFEATADTANPEFTWYTSDSATLDVDSSTGAWEALQMGTVRVTVSVVDGDKTGTAFADIVVNGGTLISPAAANSIAASLPNGATSEYYVYVEGYVAEFATNVKDGNPRAFDISTEDETSRIMVYTNADPYAEFVDGLVLGDAIRVKGQLQNYNGKYEIVNPVRTYSEYVALSFAFELLAETDVICENYDGVTDNHDVLELLWGNLAVKYGLLNDAQKNRLMDPESYGMGQTVLDAMERYDYITGKYGLTNFITGRTPTQFVNPVADATNNFNSNSNSMIIIVSAIAAMSVISIGVLLVIKKRKHN